MKNHVQNLKTYFNDHAIHVYGATGAEGSAVIRWLVSIGHTNIVAHDFSEDFDAVTREWLRVNETATQSDEQEFTSLFTHKSITWRLGSSYATLPGDDDVFFVTQSWFRYKTNDFLKRFFTDTHEVRPEYESRVWTITRLYFALFPGKIIGITGSDGKTTTTRMIATIMHAHASAIGVRCFEMGNDRTHTQSISNVAEASSEDFLVLEVSDRQLSANFSFAPTVAVITNVTPNKHMDDYGGFEGYVQKKANLVRHQSREGIAVLNADNDPSAHTIVSVGAGERLWVSMHVKPERGMWSDGGAIYEVNQGKTHPIMSVSDIPTPGTHSIYNAMQALIATHAVGVPYDRAVLALTTFKGVQHRLQPIRTWNRILFVEDSSGGNPANIPVTIDAFRSRPLVIIMGGYRQNLTQEEVQPIIDALSGPHSVVALLLIGHVAPALQELLLTSVSDVPRMYVVETLQGAIGWVADHVGEITRGGDAVVCMTPAFESFDQYRDYRARADHFIELVNSL